MNRDDVPYTAYYCEENVFKLLEPLFGDGPGAGMLKPDADAEGRWIAVVISNAAGAVAMREQRARPGGTVHWDYHVAALALGPSGETAPLVYDPDTLLEFPTPASEYLARSFPERERPEARTAPRFKCLSAAFYVRYFASDRRHMIDARGQYLAPPPQWPAIRPERGTLLPGLVDMRHALFACPLEPDALARLIGVRPADSRP